MNVADVFGYFQYLCLASQSRYTNFALLLYDPAILIFNRINIYHVNYCCIARWRQMKSQGVTKATTGLSQYPHLQSCTFTHLQALVVDSNRQPHMLDSVNSIIILITLGTSGQILNSISFYQRLRNKKTEASK